MKQTKHYLKKMSDVENFVRQHLDKKLSVDGLAEVAFLSPFHFHRVFKAMTGESVHEFVTRIRMEQAGQKLKFTTQKIGDIAFSVGYENPETFNRAFLKYYGVPPRNFRKNQKELVEKRIDKIVKERIVAQLIPVEIKKMESIKVAFLEHKGAYRNVGATWMKLIQQLPTHYPVKSIGISYNDPHLTDPSLIRYDACVIVDEKINIPEHIPVKKIGGGWFASTVHKGPYERLDETYHLLYGLWLSTSSYELRDVPPMEIYLNDARSTPPGEALTEILLPIKK
ncbi:MAG: AraC family transcriptional regulator [Bacteroidota bacterium]